MVINTFRHCTLYCEKLRITRIARMTMTHPCTYVPISTVHSRKDERMRENEREKEYEGTAMSWLPSFWLEENDRERSVSRLSQVVNRVYLDNVATSQQIPLKTIQTEQQTTSRLD